MKRILYPLACLGMLLLMHTAAGQETAQETACREALKFLTAECLVQRSSPEFPGTISGPGIRHGCDRIRSGWLIYLYAADPAGQETSIDITLDMKKVRLVINTLDLLTKERFPGYNLTLTIPPGQFRILHVRTESFEPDYEQYFE